MWFVPSGSGDEGDGAGGPGPDGDPPPAMEPVDRWGFRRALVLAAACAFLAAAVTYFVMSIPNHPGEDSVDVGFLRDMTAHHGAAVDLALAGAEYAEDRPVRTYARDVIVWQRYEMGVMDRLLGEWGYEGHRSPEATAMAWMGMPVPVANMPGMPTGDVSAEIAEAEGAEADRIFLEVMIEHHRGGIHMAEYARDHAATRTVRAYAERMVEEQAEELDTYRRAQERLGFPTT